MNKLTILLFLLLACNQGKRDPVRIDSISGHTEDLIPDSAAYHWWIDSIGHMIGDSGAYESPKPAPQRHHKPKPVYHDSVYYRTDIDTAEGLIEFRAINHEIITRPGIRIHEQTWQVHETVPQEPEPPVVDDSAHIGISVIQGSTGILVNTSDTYFLKGKKLTQLNNEDVLVFRRE